MLRAMCVAHARCIKSGMFGVGVAFSGAAGGRVGQRECMVTHGGGALGSRSSGLAPRPQAVRG